MTSEPPEGIPAVYYCPVCGEFDTDCTCPRGPVNEAAERIYQRLRRNDIAGFKVGDESLETERRFCTVLARAALGVDR